jgi:hypothetical protein
MAKLIDTKQGPKGTCQICLRQIGIGTGRVAHHGYQRPHEGWQTASCFGARYRSLEVACDALRPAIEQLNSRIDSLHGFVQAWRATPPTIEVRYSHGLHKGDIQFRLTPPQGFDPATPSPGSYRAGSDDHYRCAYASQIARWHAEMKACGADKAALTKRLVEWQPAQAEAEAVVP